jgi:hypothetical protein
VKLSKCYKSLTGLKETTKPKDNLVKIERVYKWNKCQTRQMHQYKNQTCTCTAEHKGTCACFADCWEVLLSGEGRTGSVDRSWGQQMWPAAFSITGLKGRFQWRDSVRGGGGRKLELKYWQCVCTGERNSGESDHKHCGTEG